jgi:NAD(P)-dependent dehydrogenase (short-subunit alcohol dehydrogenase family)
MSSLNSFTTDLNVAVIGASGGIGAEFVRQLAGDPRVARVYALSRTPIESRNDKVVAIPADIGDEGSIAAAAWAATHQPLDLVILATGILHRGEAVQPEKALKDIDADAMMEVLRINAVGPALGGWVSYRASKSALNMILKTQSIEHARRFPDSVVTGLHPGTVDTRLSAPFQRRVPEGKLFSPAQSVGCMLAVIDSLSPADTGGIFAWDGKPIEY